MDILSLSYVPIAQSYRATRTLNCDWGMSEEYNKRSFVN
jgi:hypothetical protein